MCSVKDGPRPKPPVNIEPEEPRLETEPQRGARRRALSAQRRGRQNLRVDLSVLAPPGAGLSVARP